MCHHTQKVVLLFRCSKSAHFLCMDCFFLYLVLSYPFYCQQLVSWLCSFVSTVPKAFRKYKLMSGIYIDIVMCAVLSSQSSGTMVIQNYTNESCKAVIRIYIGQALAVSAWFSMDFRSKRKTEDNLSYKSLLVSDDSSLQVLHQLLTLKSGTICHTHSVTAKFSAALLADMSFQDSKSPTVAQGGCYPVSNTVGKQISR